MRLPWKAKMVTGSSRGVLGRLCVAAPACAAGRSPAGSVRVCGGSLCGSSPRSSRHVSGSSRGDVALLAFFSLAVNFKASAVQSFCSWK